VAGAAAVGVPRSPEPVGPFVYQARSYWEAAPGLDGCWPGHLIDDRLCGRCFILAQSRIALIALVLALFLAPAVLLVRRWRWAYLVGLALVVMGLIVTAWQQGWVQTLYTSTTAGVGSIDNLDTLNGRVVIWQGAIVGIQDFPVTGMGMNVFRVAINTLYPQFSSGSGVDIGHAHNEFLTAALDLGLPGLVAFLLLNLVSFWMLIILWRQSRDPAALGLAGKQASFLQSPVVTHALVIGLGGGLLAHALYGFADTVALGAKPGVLFWMLLGLIAGLYSLHNVG